MNADDDYQRWRASLGPSLEDETMLTMTSGAMAVSGMEGATLATGERIGQYECIRELGRGGMGAVYLARDVILGRLVAIKLLARQSRELSERFLAEARATARCNHENIVVIHDAGEYQDQPYMVLEYIEGPTLRDYLRQHAQGDAIEGDDQDPPAPTQMLRVPMSLALDLMIPVARALVHAHELSIVHRDLKPTNVLVADSGTVKVFDFGVAKLLGNDELDTTVDALSEQPGLWQTQAGAVLGTMPYMSPEQWRSGEVDGRADIWAFGIMLHEMITGRHPLAPLSPDRLRTVGDIAQPMPRLSASHPQFGPLAAVVDGCLEKELDRRLPSAAALLAELEALVSEEDVPESTEDRSPFTGLAAFQEVDAAHFFGREREVNRVVHQLLHHALVTVTGPSGAGKSSFARAGVIPALRRLPGGWDACIVRPGRNPMTSLAAAVLQASDAPAADDQSESSETWRREPGQLGALLRERARQRGRRCLLFIDQFEELYTLCADVDERIAFVTCLEAVADEASSPLRVLISLRSDFLERVAEDRRFMSRVAGSGLVFLAPMGAEQLRDALVRPLARLGYRFESDELVEHMLDALQQTQSPLPLLQFTATKLWDERDREGKLISRQSYRDIGGVAGALAVHADAVLAGLSVAERRLVRKVFLGLVTPERTRTVVPLAEMRQLAPDADAVEHVIQLLAGARLVLLETRGERYGATVELVHESLIDKWPRFGQWLDESQEDGQLLARLRAAAAQWDAQERPEGLLWRGHAARDVERWLASRRARLHGLHGSVGSAGDPGLSGLQTRLSERDENYLRAVVGLARRRRQRRRRQVSGALVFLSLVALTVSYLAVRADRAADRAAAQAAHADRQADRVRAQQAALQAGATRARNAARMAAAREWHADPTTVLALVREVEPGHLPRGWSALARWALQQDIARTVLPHPDGVRWVAFSPDGTRVVTASNDGLARVWDVDESRPLVVLRGHGARLVSAQFSPDGTRIATSSEDQTARIWPADGNGAPVVLVGHGERVWSADFSPDGTRVVTSSADRTARIWRVDGTGLPVVLGPGRASLSSAVFSPDGARVGVSSLDGITRLWNADGTGEPMSLSGHTDRVYALEFSPDGRKVVTASADRTARVHDLHGGPPVVLRGHRDRVYSAVFSPDGRKIATASSDKTLGVWNADGSGRPRMIQAHLDRTYHAEFSPDGTRIATASLDRSARIFDLARDVPRRALRGHRDKVHWAEFNPDGTLVVTASSDRTARIHRADGSGVIARLSGHRDRLSSVAFSPDGTRVVSSSLDKTARIWPVDGSGPPIVLGDHQDLVYAAAFSPDGASVATASGDRIARIWPSDGSGSPTRLRGHDDFVYTVAFSPDGTRLVTASADKTARIWSLDTAQPPVVLRGHEDRVYSAIFNADGTLVATGSADRTVRIWNADGTGEARVLRGHSARTNVRGGRAFSPDGRRIVTHADDGTVRLWPLIGAGEPLVLRGLGDVIHTAAFSPDGARIVTSSDDDVAWVISELEPLQGIGDAKLWTATTYCMSVDRRLRLLEVAEDMAQANRERCRQRARAPAGR